jgi:hypothetical protein
MYICYELRRESGLDDLTCNITGEAEADVRNFASRKCAPRSVPPDKLFQSYRALDLAVDRRAS